MQEDTFESAAMRRLKEHGFRITMPRLLIIRTLAKSNRAMSAQDIHQEVTREGGRIDMVSVYRTITTLLEAHLVHHIGVVDGYHACQMSGDHARATKHAICRRCGRIEESEASDSEIATSFESISWKQFRPESLHVEILGLCPACA